MIRVLMLIVFGALGYRWVHRQGEIAGRVACGRETEAYHHGVSDGEGDFDFDPGDPPLPGEDDPPLTVH